MPSGLRKTANVPAIAFGKVAVPEARERHIHAIAIGQNGILDRQTDLGQLGLAIHLLCLHLLTPSIVLSFLARKWASRHSHSTRCETAPGPYSNWARAGHCWQNARTSQVWHSTSDGSSLTS